MTKIKKFTQILESVSSQEAEEIRWNLKEGMTVIVPFDKLKEFYDIVEVYEWINFIELNFESTNINPIYFTLIGYEILWTDTPKFGSHYLKTYTPKW